MDDLLVYTCLQQSVYKPADDDLDCWTEPWWPSNRTAAAGPEHQKTEDYPSLRSKDMRVNTYLQQLC